MLLLQKLWRDEGGFVVSSELILIATVLVIGLLVGMVALRDQVTQELADVADAISELNQSYEFNTITAPESAALVPPGPIDVSGTGRGFEATVVVQAFIVELGTEVDMQVTQGGSFADPEPYEVTLDLSGAEVGDTVILLVKGGVGWETDPGDFSAIPVVIGP